MLCHSHRNKNVIPLLWLHWWVWGSNKVIDLINILHISTWLIYFVLAATTRAVAPTETKTNPAWPWFLSQGTVMSRRTVPADRRFHQGHQTATRCLHESLCAWSSQRAFNHQPPPGGWWSSRSSGESQRRHLSWMRTFRDWLVHWTENP